MSKPVNDILVYPVADMMDMAMNEMPDGRWRAAGSRTMRVGLFQFEAEMVVISDVVEVDHQIGYFARVLGNLWMYLVCTHPPGKVNGELVAHVFDARVVDLKVKDAATFGGKSVADTLAKLQPAVRQTLQFSIKSNKWEAVGVSDLVNES